MDTQICMLPLLMPQLKLLEEYKNSFKIEGLGQNSPKSNHFYGLP